MGTPLPRPLAELPQAVLQGVIGVMTDIDDTLTHDGAIEPAALDALHALADAHVPVIAITGRPLGWSRPFAADWPVQAIVAENGGAALLREGRRVQVEYAQDAPTRTANAARLQAAAQDVLQQVPGALLARDSAGRETDIAIDHSEFTRLPPADIERVVQVMRAHGLNATVSSIHVNGWVGGHSKWTAAQWMVRRLHGREVQAEIHRWVYVGDSTNDQVMFERFPLAVGVANLMRFAAELRCWPAWITQGERGRGFAEVAQAVLAARG